MGNKIEYLNMVQNTIARMSSTSAILKGFAATVVTGISAISFTEIDKTVLLLSVLPVISFLVLDAYYLCLERKYRYLFKMIREDKKELDFSMDIGIEKQDKKVSKTRLVDLLLSVSIWPFYLPAVVIVVIIIVMKFGGAI